MDTWVILPLLLLYLALLGTNYELENTKNKLKQLKKEFDKIKRP